MADNLTTQSATPATIPASTVIATDDAGAGGHVQIVKLAIATNGSVTLIPADATDGMLVNLGANNDVTVTGTVTVGSHAVTNAGTFATQVTSIAAGNNNIGDVDVASSALPTGAATEATLANIYAAVRAEDDASADAHKGIPAMAVRKGTAANTSGTDGDYEFLQISAGRLWTSAVIDTALPAGTAAIGKLAANSGVDIGDVDITSIAAGDNNIGNVDIVTMPNVTLAAGTNTNEVVGDAAHDAAAAGNPLLVGGVASAAAPTNVSTDLDVVRAWHLLNGAAATVLTAAGALIGGDATNGLDVDVTRLSALVAGSALIGDVGIQGRATGGLSIFRSLDLDESEEDVKTSAGTLYWCHAVNTTNAVLYLKFYNATAANVTVGTTTPVMTLPIPGNNDTDGAGFTFTVPQGLAFATAISAAATTGVADADTGAPAANAVIVNMGYA